MPFKEGLVQMIPPGKTTQDIELLQTRNAYKLYLALKELSCADGNQEKIETKIGPSLFSFGSVRLNHFQLVLFSSPWMNEQESNKSSLYGFSHTHFSHEQEGKQWQQIIEIFTERENSFFLSVFLSFLQPVFTLEHVLEAYRQMQRMFFFLLLFVCLFISSRLLSVCKCETTLQHRPRLPAGTQVSADNSKQKINRKRQIERKKKRKDTYRQIEEIDKEYIKQT